MFENLFKHLHISKKVSLAGLGLMLLGVTVAIPLLMQNQDNRSRASASSTLSFTPVTSSPMQRKVGDTITLSFEINPGTNLVSFIQYVIKYDSTKLQLSSNPISVNTASFPDILDGPILGTDNGSATLTQTVSIGADPSKAIITTSKVATITFNAIGMTGETPTAVSFGNKTQVLSLSNNDGANENVLSSTNPSYIVIGPGSAPTQSPTQPPTPTQSVCKVGTNSFSTNTDCGNGNTRYATYTCYDGFSGKLGDPTSCKSSSLWQQYAQDACKGRTSCSVSPIIPTPTISVPTPTLAPFPSISCKVGVNSLRLIDSCGGNKFQTVSYACYDGKQGIAGGPTACKPANVWVEYAQDACKGRSSCSVNPNVPTPTPKR